jgi:hypothetical protein
VAFAQMDNITKTWVQVGTNSNSDTYTVRGLVEGVWVDVAANVTNAVTITCDEGTIFSKSVTADGFYPIRVPMYSTAGAALYAGAYTNGLVPVYGQMPLATPVTIRAAHAAGTTTTNSITVKFIFKK